MATLGPEAERERCLRAILDSTSRKKLIVAGPGTGKTHTFREITQPLASGTSLAFTLLGGLAKDMAQGLGAGVEARTFHSFCKKHLHTLPPDGIDHQFLVYPKLERIVLSDADALGFDLPTGTDDFNSAFQLLEEEDGRLAFFLHRAAYYNAVGFDDSVFRVVRHFRENPGAVPSYAQVLVDEFQDFSPLEVAFIHLLVERSPILIVGDDDQAIYDFRNASNQHIREKAADATYERFELPYCSRCTEVIVQASKAVLQRAVSKGLLAGRLEKRYEYFPPSKNADSARYPKIKLARCSMHRKATPLIARYIGSVLKVIPNEEREAARSERYPVALIIGPRHYLKQIYDVLKDDEPSISLSQGTDREIRGLEGYEILLGDAESNLGWRVLLEVYAPDLLPAILREAQTSDRPLHVLVDDEFRRVHLGRVEQLRRLATDPENVPHEEQSQIADHLDMSLLDLLAAIKKSSALTQAAPTEEAGGEPDAPDVAAVQLTTFNGSKGLSAAFVFVVGLEEGQLPKSNATPTDTEVCQFVVALTRTRKECHLINTKSFGGKQATPSGFIRWIPAEYVAETTITAATFKTPAPVRTRARRKRGARKK